MAEGIQIFNDAGYSQIDENYANLVFVNKGVCQVRMRPTSNPGAQPYHGTVTIWGNMENAMVFIRPLGCAAQVIGVRPRDNNRVEVDVVANTDADVMVYVFGKMPNDGGGAPGIVVYDTNGRVTFNSNYRPLRIAAVVKQADGRLLVRNGVQPQFVSVNWLPWGEYAICAGSTKTDTIPRFMNNTMYSESHADAFTMEGNGFTSRAVLESVYQGSSDRKLLTGGYYVVIKVNGL